MDQLLGQSPSLTGEHPTTITPAPVAPSPAPVDDARYLDRLAELWASHRRVGLEVRHRTGLLLNERFGEPTTRQVRGEGQLKQAAERLCVDVSELSRMRNFAYKFESLDKFVQQTGCTTWTEVKALLPTLKAAKPKPEGGSKTRKDAKRFYDRCCQRIDALTERLEQVATNGLSEPQRQALQVHLEKVAEVARTRLGIAVTVGEVQ